MNKDVIAITVTFNRSQTLKKTIACLINQSYKNLKKVVIVDNNSSQEHKKNILAICEKYKDKIDFLELKENIGGAGGFYEGLKYAYEKYNFSWFWVMDDDAYPREECLENLLAYENLENIGSLIPLIYGIDNNKYQLYHYKDVKKDYLTEIHYFEDIQDVEDVNEIRTGAFVGPLVSREAIDSSGLPDPDLFIYGDDFEYLFRLSINHKNYLIKNAIIDHEDIPKNKKGITPDFWWKQYYKYRNKYMFLSKYCKSGVVRTIYSMKLTVYLILKIVQQLFLNPNNRGNRILVTKTIFRSINDGIKRKNGKNIDPKEYLSGIK